MPLLAKKLDDFRARSFRIVPDPYAEFEAQAFGATLGHIRPSRIAIFYSSPDYSPETGSSRQVQKDDDVTCVDTLSQSPGIVAIHDPGIAFQYTSDCFRPFFFR